MRTPDSASRHRNGSSPSSSTLRNTLTEAVLVAAGVAMGARLRVRLLGSPGDGGSRRGHSRRGRRRRGREPDPVDGAGPSSAWFDFDSDAIRSAAARDLRSVAASFAQYPDPELLIAGHTDATGCDAYNHDLSIRRANAASRYLASQNVAGARMHASGPLEWEPLATNETAAGRRANRRIEVAIFAAAGARAPR